MILEVERLPGINNTLIQDNEIPMNKCFSLQLTPVTTRSNSITLYHVQNAVAYTYIPGYDSHWPWGRAGENTCGPSRDQKAFPPCLWSVLLPQD